MDPLEKMVQRNEENEKSRRANTKSTLSSFLYAIYLTCVFSWHGYLAFYFDGFIFQLTMDASVFLLLSFSLYLVWGGAVILLEASLVFLIIMTRMINMTSKNIPLVIKVIIFGCLLSGAVGLAGLGEFLFGEILDNKEAIANIFQFNASLLDSFILTIMSFASASAFLFVFKFIYLLFSLMLAPKADFEEVFEKWRKRK